MAVESDGVQSVQVGAWPAPIGITLVADMFSALMLVISMATILAVLVFAIGQPGADLDQPVFHPVYLIMAAGVSLSFLTGDLFNLFVAYEITLAASYVLITLGGRREQVRTGMTYIIINLLASTLFVVGIAWVYAATGTMNLADLSVKVAQLPDGVQTALSMFLFLVFGIKAAIFPLFFWLPDSYPTARTPVTAVFAGLLTKVGVYSIVRTQTLLFPETRPSTVLLVFAGFTMVVGVLGAIAQNDMKRILSFHIVSQIGYMILGLGLFTVSGLAGTVSSSSTRSPSRRRSSPPAWWRTPDRPRTAWWARAARPWSPRCLSPHSAWRASRRCRASSASSRSSRRGSTRRPT
jgi:multicomponent Na+:H+ antiporter subunit D